MSTEKKRDPRTPIRLSGKTALNRYARERLRELWESGEYSSPPRLRSLHVRLNRDIAKFIRLEDITFRPNISFEWMTEQMRKQKLWTQRQLDQHEQLKEV